MFKIRSIAVRLILAISLTVAVACGILGTFSIVQQRALTQLALDQQLKLQYDSVIAAIDYEGRAALAVSSVIAALPPVAEAVAKDDRDGLAALLGDAMKALKAQGIPLITFWRPPATCPSTVSMRQRCSATMPRHGAPPWWRRSRPASRSSASSPAARRSAIFGMTPIMRDGKTLANVDVGAAFGKEFVDRAKKRFGIDLAVYSFDGKEFKKLSSTFGDGVVTTPTNSRACSTASRCAATLRSTAVPPRSMSGRSRITPASRSAFSKSSRTRPSMKRQRRVHSAT